MRIIQTQNNQWRLEYENGQWVHAGEVMRDNNDIPAIFQGIADGHVELSEFGDPRAVQGIQRVPVGEFLDKYTADHERLGQTGPIGIVRDHQSHDEPDNSPGPSVPDETLESLRNKITWSLLNFASLPQSIKAFVDSAMKSDDDSLLRVAHRALLEYQTDDIPF